MPKHNDASVIKDDLGDLLYHLIKIAIAIILIWQKIQRLYVKHRAEIRQGVITR